MTRDLIAAGILMLISASAFFVSLRSFAQKGFLLNNAYIFASRQERKAMDKKPHYRQTAIVFMLLGFIFLLHALGILFDAGWTVYPAAVITVSVVVYAAASSIVIAKNGRRP